MAFRKPQWCRVGLWRDESQPVTFIQSSVHTEKTTLVNRKNHVPGSSALNQNFGYKALDTKLSIQRTPNLQTLRFKLRFKPNSIKRLPGKFLKPSSALFGGE